MGQIKGVLPLAGRLTASGVQNIPNATETSIVFDTETYDIGGLHDTVTNPSRITIPAGTATKNYHVIGMQKYAGNATGNRYFYLKKNGATYLVDNGTLPSPGATTDVVMHINDVVTLAAGDYIELRTYQTSGGVLGLHGDAQGAGCTRFVLREVA